VALPGPPLPGPPLPGPPLPGPPLPRSTAGATLDVMVTAARLHAHGEPLRLEEVQLGAPSAGEVRVELAFAGVNPVDRYIAQGLVAPDGPLPRTLGGEASGHLDGRPVLVAGGGLGARRDGLWAGAAVVPETAVIPLPDGVGLPEAAAMGVAGLTAWHTVQLAEVGPADRVAVLGAGGGAGLSAVSVAASLGATVWAQTANADKAAALRGQGADEVVVSDDGGLAQALEPLRPTVVIDSLGAGYTAAAIEALAPGGRLVLFGTSAGSRSSVELQQLYRKGLRVLGYAGLRLDDEQRRSGLVAALQALADGRLRVVVDRVVALRDVNAAFDLLTQRRVVGKVVLDLSRSG
jgi:NADPH2:quinone reductase